MKGHILGIVKLRVMHAPCMACCFFYVLTVSLVLSPSLSVFRIVPCRLTSKSEKKKKKKMSQYPTLLVPRSITPLSFLGVKTALEKKRRVCNTSASIEGFGRFHDKSYDAVRSEIHRQVDGLFYSGPY